MGANERPQISPAPSWVLPATIPNYRPESDSGAVTILLADRQTRLTNDGDTRFVETAIRIGSPQGLGAAAMGLAWDPALETLTIHRYHVLREGKTIDLLGDGSKLTIVRRETNLERATLDGQLTATFQPDDVRVGDVVDVAFTLERRDPALGGRSQTVFTIGAGLPVRYGRIRAIWPADKAVHWQAAPGSFAPHERRIGAEREMVAEFVDKTTSRPPKGAPLRFQLVNTVTASDMGSWADISRLAAPLYMKAATIAPTSPIVAEATKIAAVSPDPRSRMLAALRLVQDQTRYVLLSIDDGGYLPAPADITWTRRFGDCKGKTVLLLALLNQLHIEARPALVSTTTGDGLEARLPMLGAFDHVLVEAKIDGHSYWLDGTRSGDRTVAGLRTPDFRWALPLSDKGETLTALIPEKLDKPMEVTALDIDATAGLFVPAAVKAEKRFEGDTALVWRVILGQLPTEQRDRQLKDYWHEQYNSFTAQTVAVVDDEASGTLRLTMTGTAKLDWELFNRHRYYWLDGAQFSGKFDIAREPGPNSDAPFAVAFPSWSESRETIRLPNGGQGFTLDGGDVDKTIGVWEFHRSVQQSDGRVTLTASTRTLARETPFVGVGATNDALAAVGERGVSVDAPSSYRATDADLVALQAAVPTTADALLERGGIRFRREDYEGARADFDAAIALKPDDSYAHGMRALALAWRGDPQAEAAAARALALNPKESRAWNARAVVAIKAGKLPDAEIALSKSIEIWSGDPWTYGKRMGVRAELGRDEDALTDADAALALEPNSSALILVRAGLLVRVGRRSEAATLVNAYASAHPNDVDFDVKGIALLIDRHDPAVTKAALDALVARHPGNDDVLDFRAQGRATVGDRAGAVADMTAIIAKKPDAYRLIERAQLWPITDRAHWEADIGEAEGLKPNDPIVLKARTVLETRQGNYKAAETALDRAEKLAPHDSQIKSLRLDLLQRQGRNEEAVALMESFAKGPDGPSAAALNAVCWAKATLNIRLASALSDCDEALKLNPQSAAALDSRGFAKLRLGQFDGAIADFDAALVLRPNQVGSLFARGLAKMRKGLDGSADLNAARKFDAGVDAEYAKYGVTAK